MMALPVTKMNAILLLLMMQCSVLAGAPDSTSNPDSGAKGEVQCGSVQHLYGAAGFEGREAPTPEDWQKIIADPCSIEWILDWREGVSNIVDGVASHDGAEVINTLINRSLEEGSVYLYIALVPYADADMREKYAAFFQADDAFRAAFDARLPKGDR